MSLEIVSLVNSLSKRSGRHCDLPLFFLSQILHIKHDTIFPAITLLIVSPKKESNMDILKLCEKVLESEEVQGIPVVYVYLVMNCVIEAINSGECFYPTE